MKEQVFEKQKKSYARRFVLLVGVGVMLLLSMWLSAQMGAAAPPPPRPPPPPLPPAPPAADSSPPRSAGGMQGGVIPGSAQAGKRRACRHMTRQNCRIY